MDDELRILGEAMVVKERLRLLAELQGSYLAELQERDVEQQLAEQLVVEWSRHAYSMTFRNLPAPGIDSAVAGLLADPDAPASAAPAMPAPPVHRSADDPSSVPAGEPWLSAVPEPEPEAEPTPPEAEEDTPRPRREGPRTEPESREATSRDDDGDAPGRRRAA